MSTRLVPYGSGDNKRLLWSLIGAVVLTLVITLMFVSCSRPAYAPPAYQTPVVGAAPVVQPGYAPAPVVVGGAPTVVHHDNGTSNMLMGGALGYMLGRGSQSNNTTTVVQQPSYTTTAPAQRYYPSTTYSRAPTPAPVFRPSTTTNSRGVTTTTTRSGTSFGTRRR